MLSTLKIKNIALARDIEIDFEPGFNVLTGETGAGKSLLLSSLMLGLGEKWDKRYMRHGETKGSVSMLIDNCREKISPVAKKHDIPSEDEQLLIKRDFSSDNRNKAYINAEMVPMSVLKEAGEYLLDYHSQNSHQFLLKNNYQLEILDLYGEVKKEQYIKAYNNLVEAKDKLSVYDNEGKVSPELAELYSFQSNEIQKACLKNEENEELEKEHTLLVNASRIAELAQEGVDLLYDTEDSVFNKVGRVASILKELGDITGEKMEHETMENFASVSSDTANELRNLAERLDLDSSRLERIENRIELIHRLKKKYGSSISEIHKKLVWLEEQLEKYRSFEKKREDLLKKVSEEECKVLGQAQDLTKKRVSAGEKLASKVEKELKQVGLKEGKFKVHFKEKELSITGKDGINFIFSANRGEKPQPLKDVASGGEISRLMLSLKSVLAGKDLIPILVFDEIDVNIGGETALSVGRKLKSLSKTHQVICITHLPQIASMADTHFSIEKSVEKDRTSTGIKKLSKEKRVEEIARMLGGKSITSVSLTHARELLENAVPVIS